jgi:hypothetical protein
MKVYFEDRKMLKLARITTVSRDQILIGCDVKPVSREEIPSALRKLTPTHARTAHQVQS